MRSAEATSARSEEAKLKLTPTPSCDATSSARFLNATSSSASYRVSEDTVQIRDPVEIDTIMQ